MNTILNLYIRKENWKLESPLEKFLNLEIFSPWKNFHYYSKNLEFRKPLDLKFSENLDSDDLNCGTVYKILRKSMIYIYFISCFDEPLLFRLLSQRSSTVGFSASVNSVVRLPTNILFPSINMLIAAFKSLS